MSQLPESEVSGPAGRPVPGPMDRVMDRLVASAPTLLVRAGVAVAIGLVVFLILLNNGVSESSANEAALYVTLAAVLAQLVVAFEPPPEPAERRLRPNPVSSALARGWTEREQLAAALRDRALATRQLVRPDTGASHLSQEDPGREQVLALIARARHDVAWATSRSVEQAVWSGAAAGRLRAQLDRAARRGVRVRCLIVPDVPDLPDAAEPGTAGTAPGGAGPAPGPRPEVRQLAADRPGGAASLREHGCLVLDELAYCVLGAAPGRPAELLLSTRAEDVRRGRAAFEAWWTQAGPA